MTGGEAVGRALAEIAAGRPVVVSAGEGGVLAFAAEKATSSVMAFLVRHTSGLVAVALPEPDCDRLGLGPMAGADSRDTPYTVTVDARDGVGTGISAADRAHTARLLAAAGTSAADLSRPGHVMGLRTHERGVLGRAAPAEAVVDLARLAGLRPAGVVAGIVSPRDPRRMAQQDELVEFAQAHGLTRVSAGEVAGHRRAAGPHVVDVLVRVHVLGERSPSTEVNDPP